MAIVIIFGVVIIALLMVLFYKRTTISAEIENVIGSVRDNQQALQNILREEIAHSREELNANLRQSRTEMGSNLKLFEDSVLARMKENENSQKNQLDTFSKELTLLTQLNEQKLEAMREAVEKRLELLQQENAKKLDQMRMIVDEKLHATIDRRLNESFKLVGEQLEAVQRGFGEMRSLAQGVGDLKKVLTNVKAKGIFGEMQLGMLLEDVFSPEQYTTNVITKKDSNERVEFAIRLPGRDASEDRPVWLPIDSKFPQEDYERLLRAYEEANLELVEKSRRQLEVRIKMEAKEIHDKYISPPDTTDFAIMYLPTEGLYAEVLRSPGLFNVLRRDYNVIITGPTTLTALLNSLQMGFRTLAIQKRSSEVWRLLANIKLEFSKFGEMLERTRKKLTEATETIDSAAKKTHTIETKLKDVQELPSQQKPDFVEHIIETNSNEA